jgi:hypothetical protein
MTTDGSKNLAIEAKWIPIGMYFDEWKTTETAKLRAAGETYDFRFKHGWIIKTSECLHIVGNTGCTNNYISHLSASWAEIRINDDEFVYGYWDISEAFTPMRRMVFPTEEV